jgi:predicted metalloprotease
MGPFYCPADNKIYIDLAFFRQLETEFAAQGDFAKAYVIAHEVGHHVQTVTGTSAKVRQAQQGASEAEANALQVKMELQADCYAGIWAHHADRARQLVEAGDINEALGAASAVGDDTIQKRVQGRVNQESFTHGRARWLALRHRRAPILHEGQRGRGVLARDPARRRLSAAAAHEPDSLPGQPFRLSAQAAQRAARARPG